MPAQPDPSPDWCTSDLSGSELAELATEVPGAQFVFGDGHVSFLNENIDLLSYRALSTRAGGETISSEELQ